MSGLVSDLPPPLPYELDRRTPTDDLRSPAVDMLGRPILGRPMLGLEVPMLGREVPMLGRDVPMLGREVPMLGRDVPMLGRPPPPPPPMVDLPPPPAEALVEMLNREDGCLFAGRPEDAVPIEPRELSDDVDTAASVVRLRAAIVVAVAASVM